MHALAATRQARAGDLARRDPRDAPLATTEPPVAGGTSATHHLTLLTIWTFKERPSTVANRTVIKDAAVAH